MKNISSLKGCYKCGICVNVCPKEIIKFELDKNGFFTPVIHNENNCIECGLCLKVCAFNNAIGNNNTESYFAGWSLNEHTRSICSSGGIAFELAKFGIENGYTVIGVRYNPKDKIAEHFEANTIEDLLPTTGSKYIQSYAPNGLKNIFKGNKYMIFGLPCQIHTLRNIITHRKKESNFILIDFFCHGVPSYLMWKKYLNEKCCTTGKIKHIDWRNKKKGGWHNSWNMVLVGEKGVASCSISENDLFYRFFLKNRCLNAACYDSCRYKMNNSAADIRLGDLWGQKFSYEEKGVSGIVSFTEKGLMIIKRLKGNVSIANETGATVLESQMRDCAKRPASYKIIRKLLQTPLSLKSINNVANIIELIIDKIPMAIKYYPNRALEKMLDR